MPSIAESRAIRIAALLDARSMLLPGVTAREVVAHHAQHEATDGGLGAGSDTDFVEALQAYVEVCNEAQVTARVSDRGRGWVVGAAVARVARAPCRLGQGGATGRRPFSVRSATRGTRRCGSGIQRCARRAEQ